MDSPHYLVLTFEPAGKERGKHRQSYRLWFDAGPVLACMWLHTEPVNQLWALCHLRMSRSQADGEAELVTDSQTGNVSVTNVLGKLSQRKLCQNLCSIGAALISWSISNHQTYSKPHSEYCCDKQAKDISVSYSSPTAEIMLKEAGLFFSFLINAFHVLSAVQWSVIGMKSMSVTVIISL